MNKRFLFAVALIAIVAVLPSCGKKTLKTSPVTGTITLDGAPLADANIFFTPSGGTGDQAVGKSDASGVYKIQTPQGAPGAGTTPGEYVVTITCQKVVKEAEKNAEGEIVSDEVTDSAIPKTYGDPKQSGLTASVVKGDNKIDFELSSK